jgi:hypothetical protein
MPPQEPEVTASFQRATRWHSAAVLRALAEATGVDLADEGRCRGGEVGASYVRWPDGHRSVLTCLEPDNLAWAQQGAELAGIARAAGVPAPRYELVAELPGVIAVIQELLPGAPPGRAVSRVTVESMLAVNRRCRGLLAGRDDLPVPSLYLRGDGPGFCLHKPVASYDQRTAPLLAAIEEIGAAVPERLAGDDVMHFDFHPGNVLADPAGQVTGVVDWDGASRGSGVLDLWTLRFDLARRAPELGRWIGTLLPHQASEAVHAACWAHMSLRLVDWAIREHTAAEVDSWIGVAEQVRP